MKKIPGFVDLQVNGFLGVDFSSPSLTEEQCAFAWRKIIERGTAAFLPTVITSSKETYKRNLPIIAKLMKESEFEGHVLGLHIEGPFISNIPGAVGAHNPEWVIKPDVEFLEKMIEWSEGTIKILTIAAETENACGLTEFATSRGITVSLGHQMALGDELAKASASGATAITHLGNGMPNLIHRHNNTLWAALAEDRLTGMLITDGHHLPPAIIKTALRAKGVDNIVVVSDASPIAGSPPGRYNVLGNDTVLEENGLLHNPEKECMVGSSACMLDCMNFLASLKLLSFDELMQVGFDNPLKLIGVDKKSVKACENVACSGGSKAFEII